MLGISVGVGRGLMGGRLGSVVLVFVFGFVGYVVMGELEIIEKF